MKTINLLLLIILLSGCTNYLYKGTGVYLDGDREQEAIAYWNNTTHIFSQGGKPSTVTLLAACSNYRIQFADHGGVPKFEVPSGDFRRVRGMGKDIDSSTIECGEFLGKEEVTKKKATTASARIFCDKISSPLNPAKSIPAREEPYEFDFVIESRFSIMGGEIKPPVKPRCK
jgi:hypothetical protein